MRILPALALLALLAVAPARAAPDSPVDALLAAAAAQIGVTTRYDPAYRRLAYPGGDPPREVGVCTDVIVRAYRDAFGLDLQKSLREDMGRAFAAYPRRWGLAAPDPNIDHRRVPNLQTFFARHGRVLPVSADPAAYAPGDLVTQMLPGHLPHIAIVARQRSADGRRPLVIHNIGAGARMEDTLFAFPITGRYRFGPLAAR
ncbi:MAG: DUF1287 domain-containing protein [Methylobacteriaceae bacterium]|nr:DUF1287 domain-containing protein [Methylobacteriaceae bacterium]